jgi:hypothetical protein
VDIEIPMGLICRNAVHTNFGGVIPLVFKGVLREKTYGGISPKKNLNPLVQRGRCCRETTIRNCFALCDD